MTEVSQITGIPVRTLRWYRLQDIGPRSFRLGRRVVYDREELDGWLEERWKITGAGG